MRILYGIQGTGNGHVTRSTQIIETLQKKGASIDVIFSGCGKDKVFDRSIIPSARFFKGFTFAIRRGRLRFLETARQLSVVRYIKDVCSFDAAGYDLVITDFEPVSAMIAKKNGLPGIGIGHQYAFLHKIPMGRGNRTSRLILENFASADYAIGMHWHHFNQPIIPPVIMKDVRPAKENDPELILVYLPFEDFRQIRGLLSGFHRHTFAVYGGGTRHLKKEKEGNIIWHPFSKTVFYDDLSRCSGVICNAGFELPSEALYLGKKILVKPLAGQFEQVSNAMALEKLNLGMMMTSLNKKILHHWLKHGRQVKLQFPDVAEKISQWILEGNWSDTRQLVNTAWN